MIDIYFNKYYGKLYEKLEGGICETFVYKSEIGEVHHLYIKRVIPIDIENKCYYDLVTPYGYGGPIIKNCLEEDKAKLVNEFKEEFKIYCLQNNIVSEFIRFHPLIKNASDFKYCYDLEFSRNTLGTNLKDYDDPYISEFSKSCRKNIRKALAQGIDYKVTEKPNDIQKFKEIYYSTMNRNNASEYYYFDEMYFEKCLEMFRDNILVVEAIYGDKTIAMGFYFTFDKMIHIHLSGTLSEYLYLSPAYILRYAVTQWGKENGYHMIHHGGGRTNNPEDSLYKFKKQFSKNTEFQFYIGTKIWNKNVYEELSRITKTLNTYNFFPKYRSEKAKELILSN